MVNSIKLTLNALDLMIHESIKLEDAPISEKAGLYAAIRIIIEDILQHIEKTDGSGYISEKLSGIRWHTGAILGFDITNNHASSQHLSWALSDLSVIQNQLGKD
jgi:hypothetical protein